MAIRHQLIRRPTSDVWKVLSDVRRYGDWVPGTAHSEPGEGAWPQPGSSLTFTVNVGWWSVSGQTTVRRCEEPDILELEADSGWLGTVRIAIDVRPWGENTLVIIDEHPLTGIGDKVHNPAADALLQLRHRTMLTRLARVVEEAAPTTRSPQPV
ncbi:SRPBCC family protein [Streptomyces sp. NPDC002795]|uniref:SRPBCC family protein n=1 Tax=Streptomyces sp. NPDC002795 TaxID=3364665 RepID=UPI0036A78878